MGLKYCPNCQQLEGDTVEYVDGVIECAECEEEIIDVPEHDDCDMER